MEDTKQLKVYANKGEIVHADQNICGKVDVREIE